MTGALNAIGLGATEILRVPFDPTELVIRASQAIHRANCRSDMPSAARLLAVSAKWTMYGSPLKRLWSLWASCANK